jgi:hypothetical protein
MEVDHSLRRFSSGRIPRTTFETPKAQTFEVNLDHPSMRTHGGRSPTSDICLFEDFLRKEMKTPEA